VAAGTRIAMAGRTLRADQTEVFEIESILLLIEFARGARRQRDGGNRVKMVGHRKQEV
jgi:hypothetical protein